MTSSRRLTTALAATALLGASLLTTTGTASASAPTQAGNPSVQCTKYVAVEDLNIRAQPSSGSTFRGTLKRGESICGTPSKSGSSYTACGKTSAKWMYFSHKTKGRGHVVATCLKG
ncbi:hypothetical protein MTQ01_09420 [Streptomyces sp. XM4193]|uniref:hypothetical protein n=1 Tax=Streptomyces sp. XM4193 TaxID=2929782 RepID=UPI001FF94FE4|nr:hypothetical protein [Streptomyces sp. XM4193]MCK1796217.1 hypothetical protein [Streptomyces sp. XM4193]